jgi:hypothetical protein
MKAVINGVKWKEKKYGKNCSKVQWSEVKCSDLRWMKQYEILNGVKPNERVVKFGEVLNGKKWSVDKCSEVEWKS